MRLSKSRMLMYKRCPMMYYLYAVCGITYPANAIMKFGSLMHESFETFYAEPEKNIKKIGDKYKKKHIKDTNYCIHMNNFMDFNKRKIKESKKNFKPLFVEQNMSCKITKNTELTGIVDRIEKWGDDIIITDYKTGRFNPVEEYDFELHVYWKLAKECLNIDATHLGIYFSKVNIFDTMEVDPEYFDDNVLPLIKEIESKDHKNEAEFPPVEKCDSWCTYKSMKLCPCHTQKLKKQWLQDKALKGLI